MFINLITISRDSEVTTNFYWKVQNVKSNHIKKSKMVNINKYSQKMVNINKYIIYKQRKNIRVVFNLNAKN